MKFTQVPHTVLMIRPANFGFNPETASSNAFQKLSEDASQIGEKAVKEFDAVVESLKTKNIPVLVVEDRKSPVTTDAVFPNNWITTHDDGRIILYPMMAPSRRLERRQDIVELLATRFVVQEVIDLSTSENQNIFLEGTGSIIFNHSARTAYACRSPRTDDKLFQQVCETLNYKAILFDAVDENGAAIYHTNVMMWIGEKLAGICLDSIHDEASQEQILDSLAQSGHRVIALSHQQMKSFAGNMFEVKNSEDDRFMLMSESAFESLLPGQLNEMIKYVQILPLSIPTIEESGGGSIRCMVAGIHLPKR